jgi:hypothetical protein
VTKIYRALRPIVLRSARDQGQTIAVCDYDLRPLYLDDIGISQMRKLSANVLARDTQIATQFALRQRQVKVNAVSAHVPMLISQPEEPPSGAASHLKSAILDNRGGGP